MFVANSLPNAHLMVRNLSDKYWHGVMSTDRVLFHALDKKTWLFAQMAVFDTVQAKLAGYLLAEPDRTACYSDLRKGCWVKMMGI